MKVYFCVNGYNCEKFVYECLKSIQLQLHKEFHCIVVNDGSTDGTKEQIERFTDTDHRFYAINREKNEGAAAARYYGIKHIKKLCKPDDIICLVDLDDWLANRGILDRVLLEYRHGADCTYGYLESNSNPIHCPREGYSNTITKEKTFRTASWRCYPMRTFKASLWNFGPEWFQDEKGKWFEVCTDVAIMFPIMERAENPVFIPDVLYIYRFDNPNSLHNKYKSKVYSKRKSTSEKINKIHAEISRKKHQKMGEGFGEFLQSKIIEKHNAALSNNSLQSEEKGLE